MGETIKLAIPINVAKNLIPKLEAGRNILVEKKRSLSQTPEDDSTPPKILSVTTSVPTNESSVKVKISTDEPVVIVAYYVFQYSPDEEARQVKRKISTENSSSTIISFPIPSWNINTTLYLSIKAIDRKGNASNFENYSFGASYFR